jgi:hypothetical protein
MAPRTALARLGAAGLTLFIVASAAVPVLAHEETAFDGYSIEVGFIDEPVYVGDRSGLELIVANNGQPVTGLERTVSAEVIFGDQTRSLPLAPREGEPGAYESIFVPTASGRYTFHLTGSIDGQALDHAWTSSSEGFDEVREATAGQFPNQLPTLAELQAASRKGADASTTANLALGVAIAGLVVGLVATGIALASRRKRSA